MAKQGEDGMYVSYDGVKHINETEADRVNSEGAAGSRDHYGNNVNMTFTSSSNSSSNAPLVTKFNVHTEIDPIVKEASEHEYRGEYEKAIELYTMALSRVMDEYGTNALYAFRHRAICFNHVGNYELALEDCNKAIELDPMLVEILESIAFTRGYAYEHLALDEKDENARLKYRKRAIKFYKYSANYGNMQALANLKGMGIDFIPFNSKHPISYGNPGQGSKMLFSVISAIITGCLLWSYPNDSMFRWPCFFIGCGLGFGAGMLFLGSKFYINLVRFIICLVAGVFISFTLTWLITPLSYFISFTGNNLYFTFVVAGTLFTAYQWRTKLKLLWIPLIALILGGATAIFFEMKSQATNKEQGITFTATRQVQKDLLAHFPANTVITIDADLSADYSWSKLYKEPSEKSDIIRELKQGEKLTLTGEVRFESKYRASIDKVWMQVDDKGTIGWFNTLALDGSFRANFSE